MVVPLHEDGILYTNYVNYRFEREVIVFAMRFRDVVITFKVVIKGLCGFVRDYSTRWFFDRKMRAGDQLNEI